MCLRGSGVVLYWEHGEGGFQFRTSYCTNIYLRVFCVCVCVCVCVLWCVCVCVCTCVLFSFELLRLHHRQGLETDHVHDN